MTDPLDEQLPPILIDFRASPHGLIFAPAVQLRLDSSRGYPVTVTITVQARTGPPYVLVTDNPYGTGDAFLVTGAWRERLAFSRTSLTGFWLGRTLRGPDLSTSNGAFTFRATVTDPNGQQYRSESTATIEWHSPRIECVVRQDGASPSRALQAFGGHNRAGFTWRLSRKALVEELKRGSQFFVERPAGTRVDVLIARSDTGLEYVRTSADGAEPNNLLSLPDCGRPMLGNKDQLYANEALSPGQEIVSQSVAFTLSYQRDGNCLLYKNDPFFPRRPIWASGTAGSSAGGCVMQGDGNLVIFGREQQYVWDSGTYANPGSRLVVQDDGNLVIYRADGVAIWATNTVQRLGELPAPPSRLGQVWAVDEVLLSVAADGCLELLVDTGLGPSFRFLGYQLGPNGGWSDWHYTTRLLTFEPARTFDVPLPNLPGGLRMKYVENLDDRTEVFAVHSDGTVRHIWQLKPQGRWSGWVAMSRPANNFVHSVYPIQNAYGCLTIFVLGIDIANSMRGNCWYRSQLRPGGPWGDWRELGAVLPPLERAWLDGMAVALNQDGRLEMFATSAGSLLQNSESTIDGDWVGWRINHRWFV